MATSPRDTESGFVVGVREIARQPGSRREVSRTFPAPAVLGSDVIGVPEGSEIGLDVSLDAVTDGLWVSGTLTAEAVGECGRCLDEVRLNVAAPLQGLFVYPDSPREEDEDEGAEDVYEFDGETIDLEAVSRDAVATELPFTPLCDPDCPGLCDQCGARLADDPDHRHETIDPRWSSLQGLTEKKES